VISVRESSVWQAWQASIESSGSRAFCCQGRTRRARPPRQGWYPKLIYRGEPESREPTIADLHTGPNSGQVVEVGVGDADFLLAAIDNKGDRTAYVGPVSSYSSSPPTTNEECRAPVGGGPGTGPPRVDRRISGPAASSAAPARPNP
jgi:hypothetical protein